MKVEDLKKLFIEKVEEIDGLEGNLKPISKPKSKPSPPNPTLDKIKDNYEYIEEFELESASTINDEIIHQDDKENSVQLDKNKSILDQWQYSNDNMNELVKICKSQPDNLGLRQKELQADFAGWRLETEVELEKQNRELQEKQEHFTKLEEKIRDSEKNLDFKVKDYEKQTAKLKEEKEKLNKREQELEKKAAEYDKRAKNFYDKLKQIESESLLLEAQRAKFTKERKQFTTQVTEFEDKLKEEISQELTQELEGSQVELENEWTKLHAEEEKLLRIQDEIYKAKNEFKERIEGEREKINNERKEVVLEWGKIKQLRKNLEVDRIKIESKLGEYLELEKMPDLSIQLKSELENQVRSELEDELRNEIREEFNTKLEETQAELKNEWSKLHVEEEKLARMRNELIEEKRIKIKENFENKLKKLKRIFKKNKHKKDEFETIKAELKAEEERILIELDDGVRDKKKQELSELAKKLELQREEIAEEWKYIKKVKDELELDRPKLESKLREDLKAELRPQLETQVRTEFEDQLISDVEKKLDDELNNDLSKELEELQAELKSELSELRSQQQKLTNARNQFSRAKSVFEKGQIGKVKDLKKFPINRIGF